ncbi:MAG: exonuclease domain-containing protein [Bacteroidetes bacterium]|nr:exonuclease domain-containing protein [Bacteroidota bacterium]
MSEKGVPPIRFAIAHCFTTGRNTHRDALLQVVCKIYYINREPLTIDWIVNPERKITRRVYTRTGISTQDAQQKPKLNEIYQEIQQYFTDLDVVFICELGDFHFLSGLKQGKGVRR